MSAYSKSPNLAPQPPLSLSIADPKALPYVFENARKVNYIQYLQALNEAFSYYSLGNANWRDFPLIYFTLR